MTTPERNPVVQQRRLRAELRAARERADLTQAQVAEEMVWSISKVIRIETGAVGLSIADLRGLLQLYGVEDRDAVAELVGMGKASRLRAWWDEFREFIGDTMIKFVGLESSASLVRQYQDDMIPGLLQTGGYARAILEVFNTDEELLAKKTEARVKRQSILDPSSGVRFKFILEEAVLRRAFGGADVMREQLERLREMSRQSNVTVMLLPFSVGTHPGVKSGSFAVLEFPGDEQDHVTAMERSGIGLTLHDDPELASQYVETFLQLEERASSAEELDELINELIRDLV